MNYYIWNIKNRESCVSRAPFPNNIVFKSQVCITQDMSTISRNFFLFMHYIQFIIGFSKLPLHASLSATITRVHVTRELCL